jgi:protein involved in polysaccharide export with SLBB domain
MVGIALGWCTGCHLPRELPCPVEPAPPAPPAAHDLPRELTKRSLPPYVIEPPDVLLIDAVLTPTSSYRLEPGDVLQILFPADPRLPVEKQTQLQQLGMSISGRFRVEADGRIDLGGERYGRVAAAGLTRAEVQRLLERLVAAEASGIVGEVAGKLAVELDETRAQGVWTGKRTVQADGTLHLGSQGSVYVAGLTLAEAGRAIEAQWLKELARKPRVVPIPPPPEMSSLHARHEPPVRIEVSLNVEAYCSKVYYVVVERAGQGQQSFRRPYRGNETVLDALSELDCVPPLSAQRQVWIARPAPPELGCDQILPVDWDAITRSGQTATNYQVFPGDRIYIQEDGGPILGGGPSCCLTPCLRAFGFGAPGCRTASCPQGNSQ